MEEDYTDTIEGKLIDYLEVNSAWWRWDGHKHVAQLTSGKVSDFYANLTSLYYSDSLLDWISHILLGRCHLDQGEDGNVWVVGSAVGGIWIARAVSEALGGARCAFTEKTTDGMELKRFDLGEKPRILLVEDVMTTGGTTRKTIDAVLLKHSDAEFCSQLCVVVNRSGRTSLEHVIGHGTDRLSFRIASIVDVKARTWDRVEDLPEEMKNCVPLRPKGNWKKLVEERLKG